MTTAAFINGSTIGWSEASGPLDTISIWNRLVAYPLEISAIGASILDQPTAGYTQQGGMVELFVPTVGSAGTFSATPPVWNYGTLVSGTLTPVYASSPIVAQGSCGNLTPHYYLSGTSCGPADDFQSYGTGTVLSGITLNGGYGWASPAVCYAW